MDQQQGTYKGRTELWDAKVADLSSLRIKQWDIAIQGVFLEGTGDYTILLPNGRGPFQKGAYACPWPKSKPCKTACSRSPRWRRRWAPTTRK